MLKQAVAVLLLVPVVAWAECGFVSSSSEMTIVVGAKANNKCFASENFREAFRANLVASVKHMDESSPAATPAAARRPRPPGLPMPVQQAELYYGQKSRR
jgi:hypothetical protein